MVKKTHYGTYLPSTFSTVLTSVSDLCCHKFFGAFLGICEQIFDKFLLLLSCTTPHYEKINIFLRINNQQGAPSIQNLFCRETLHVSGIFCAHHQELSTVQVTIGMFHAGYVAAATAT